MSETARKFPNFSLDQYLKNQGVYFNRHPGDDHTEYALNCPMCKVRGEKRNDTRRRLWVNQKKATFVCYNCGWDGPLQRFIQVFSKCEWESALRILEGRRPTTLELLSFTLVHNSGYELDPEEDTSLKEVEFPHGFTLFNDCTGATEFHDYLEKRGVPLDYAIKNGWGFSEVGFSQDRIIVPTYVDNTLVYWQARDILEEDHADWGSKIYSKVLNPKGVSARSVLYNYDTAKDHGEIILCEGFIDAVKAGPNAVATNGKSLHHAQLELLRKTKAKSIVILWDDDAYTDETKWKKGIHRGKVKKKCSIDKATSLLRTVFDTVRCVRLGTGRDAGSYEMGELEAIITSELD